MTTSYISGWDIGGAHLKVARCSMAGELLQVIQIPCPLWLGIEKLEQAIDKAQKTLNNVGDFAAITMTGELVDIFPHRQAGVAGILDCFTKRIPAEYTHVYAGDHGWLSPDNANKHWALVASRNWQASASYTARHVNNGLFVDIGSTSCDIIPIHNRTAVPKGLDDFHRLQTRELVYSGVIRTPLIALTDTAPFKGADIPIVAEVFATTGDCWLLLEKLSSSSIQDMSADGMKWDQQHCIRRIARMLGTDAQLANDSEWIITAKWFAEQQIHKITNACQHVLSSYDELDKKTPIIGAGIGRFIAQACADKLGRHYIDFSTFTTPDSTAAADHTPAVAVALLLAAEQLA